MVFVSYIHVLSAAFLMGLAAAAPMGPVNMLAIRRGVIGGWRHTLACGIGSVTGDLILFSLVLLGGHYLFSDLSNPTLQTVLAAVGVIVLLPLGIYFLSAPSRIPCGPTPALANTGTKRPSLRIWSPKSPTVPP
jgi:threonine/homoserine/homoserine lactone efflux protein